MHVSRFVWFARTMAKSALRAAGVRTGTFYLVLGIVAGVLFGGSNSLRAVDVTAAAQATRWLWIGLWFGWWIVVTPVAHTVLELPSTDLLRTLPLPRWYFLIVHALLLLIAEAPWTLLWARGEGALAAVAATLLALAGHTLLVARVGPWSWPNAIALASVLLAVALQLPWSALLGVALAAGAIGLPRAVDDAPARAVSRTSYRTVLGPAPIALGLAYAATVRRGFGATLMRGLLGVGIGAGITVLVVRNNAVTRPATVLAVVLGLGAPFLLLAAGSVAIPIALAERRDRWMLDTVGVPGTTRVFAATATTASWCVVLGILHSLMICASLSSRSAPWFSTIVMSGVDGGALGVIAAVVARWAARGGQSNGERLVLVLLPLLILVEIAIGYLGSWALGPIWLAALTLAVRDISQAAELERTPRGRPTFDHLERSE